MNHWQIEKLIDLGFIETEKGLFFQKELIEKELLVEIQIDHLGQLSYQVLDYLTHEPYLPFLMTAYQSGFVQELRMKVDCLLNDIKAFQFNQGSRLTQWIDQNYGIKPDYPWKKQPASQYVVFRHLSNRKWFALLLSLSFNQLKSDAEDKIVKVVNLKVDQTQVHSLIDYRSIFPAYHMNHQNWVSILLNDELEDEVLFSLVQSSYQLTEKK